MKTILHAAAVPLKTSTASLASPAFVASVLLLLINDFVLKPQIGNAVTGKLSDFAGLFAFPFFWSAFFARDDAELLGIFMSKIVEPLGMRRL